ncbi:hypothetical protein BU24DRAFT_418214 [Aaosphaeria arxii CBS 175.79]|uniref:Nuclear pore assembly and biogenesis-domain-containing protein n=1 Tax=Aaosphaeria arxii CBS 175.79 TaxID=1450172 RepID=A0A6A5Y1J0_9PLEO|nr:uncharacterized protein BU24DRAFT_418214 [Aaosphaeria arxii CBS 175.79]KAF2018690.1 hypothetical protein BU24DRAFT_418214 [Aaosphaeria arxii CBS 175.79]
MDILQDYLPLLHNLLPPSIISPFFKTLTTIFATLQTISTHLHPLYTRVLTAPDATSVLLLIVILFLSFKILDMAYRAVLFWVRLVLRIAFWGTVGFVGVWIYKRGVDGFIDDVEGLARFWWGEWERFEGDVRDNRRRKEEEIFLSQQASRGRSGKSWGRW